jgi:hypothetical protein
MKLLLARGREILGDLQVALQHVAHAVRDAQKLDVAAREGVFALEAEEEAHVIDAQDLDASPVGQQVL